LFAWPIRAIAILALTGCGGAAGSGAAPGVPQNPAVADGFRAAALEAQTSPGTATERVRVPVDTVTPASMSSSAIDASPPNIAGTYSGTLEEVRGKESAKDYDAILTLEQETRGAPGAPAYIDGSFAIVGDTGYLTVEGRDRGDGSLAFTIKDFHGRPAIATAHATLLSTGSANEYEIKGSAHASETRTQPMVTLYFTLTENTCPPARRDPSLEPGTFTRC